MTTTDNSLPLVGCTAEQAIPIKNAGFEEPALEDGDFIVSINESIPGWEAYDPNGLIAVNGTDVGVFDPRTAQYPDGVSERENVGYAYATDEFGSGEVGLFQELDTILAENTQYTLQVDVGNPTGIDLFGSNFTGFPGYRVELLAGDTILASEQNNLFIEEGIFVTSTVTFTTTADNTYLGENLGIRLVNVLQGPGLQVDFDNVRLTSEAI